MPQPQPLLQATAPHPVDGLQVQELPDQHKGIQNLQPKWGNLEGVKLLLFASSSVNISNCQDCAFWLALPGGDIVWSDCLSGEGQEL